jgi:hypothetical protein
MRRTPCDDNKGVGEHLNETDAYGNGLRAPAAYYVQLHSLKDKASQQRLLQMKIDDPAQYFFTQELKGDE